MNLTVNIWLDEKSTKAERLAFYEWLAAGGTWVAVKKLEFLASGRVGRVDLAIEMRDFGFVVGEQNIDQG